MSIKYSKKNVILTDENSLFFKKNILQKDSVYHFIGIGGISQSALAKWLFFMGYKVQGSDIKTSAQISELKALGINIFIGHKKQNIKNADVIIYSFAIKDNNIEFLEARKRKLQCISRAKLLSLVAKHYKNVIAISGAHGKTTTTAMIYDIFKTANKKPTLHIGAELKCGENLILGSKNYFITEACEYYNGFLELSPNISVITNIEKEHLDYFKNFTNLCKAFEMFANNSRNCVLYKQALEVLSNRKCFFNNCVYFNGVIYCAKNIKQTFFGLEFDVIKNNNYFIHIFLKAFGKHNVNNALCAIAVAEHYKIKNKSIIKALANYEGVKRRFEVISSFPFIVHDYAHHPTEIIATIKTFKKIKNGKCFLVFEPHTYSRTQKLYNEFLKAFNLADEVLFLKTYSARERANQGKSSYELYKSYKGKKYYAKNYDMASKIINKKPDYNILFLGAGTINKLAEKYKK